MKPRKIASDSEAARTASDLPVAVRVPDGVLFSSIDDEAVVLHLESGRYYDLDATGARMWSLLAEHGQIETVFGTLLEEFDVAADRLRLDLVAFLGELSREGLIEIHGAD